MHLRLSQVAEPGFPAASFEVGKPAAGWRENQNDRDPDGIDYGKPVPIPGWRIGREISQTCLQQESHRAVPDGSEEYRQPMNQKEVKHVVKERHSSEGNQPAAFSGRSAQLRKRMAGPSVISSKNIREGGYVAQFRKDRAVSKPLD